MPQLTNNDVALLNNRIISIEHAIERHQTIIARLTKTLNSVIKNQKELNQHNRNSNAIKTK